MAGLKSALQDLLEDIAHSTHRSASVSSYALVQCLLVGERARSNTPLYKRLLREHAAAISILGLNEAFSTLSQITDLKEEHQQLNEALRRAPRSSDTTEAYAKAARVLIRSSHSVLKRTKKAERLLRHVPSMLSPFAIQPELA